MYDVAIKLNELDHSPYLNKGVYSIKYREFTKLFIKI